MVNGDYQAYRSDTVTIGDWKFVVEGCEGQREREVRREKEEITHPSCLVEKSVDHSPSLQNPEIR